MNECTEGLEELLEVLKERRDKMIGGHLKGFYDLVKEMEMVEEILEDCYG